MNEKTTSFLRQVFKEYYFNNAKKIVEFPPKMEEREFGYIPFDGTMVRHLAFTAPGELIAELVRQAPSSVYCSNATYSYPRLPMEEKGWTGAELIFDIDADMIPTPCKARHNRWYCPSCRKEGRAPRPPVCQSCQRPAPIEVRWTCRECLGATKQQVYRLIDFLNRDFGVSDEEGGIRIHFSGSRGYHLQVYDDRFYTLDSRARTEIASYILGSGILPLGPLASSGECGWAERIHRSTAATAAEESRAKRTVKASQRLLNEAVQINAALIDQAVTTDVHRVFRMPGTLHGSSGLLKMRVKSLDTFDPQTDPVVLGDELTKVYIDFSPRFELKGEGFGPYNSTATSLPMHAAVFLLAKELAKVQ